MGPQASGKGTQAKIIAKKLGYVHISTGELLRREIEKGTEIGKIADSIIHGGKLVPDDVNNKLVFGVVSELNKNNKKVILDGYPRNIVQAEFTIENFSVDKVILIDISEQETIKRLSSRYHCPKCRKEYNTLYPSLKPKQEGICDVCETKLVQREDDTSIDAIKKRLEIYHDLTEKMIPLFTDKIVKINGEQEIEKVTEDVIKIL